MTLEESKEADSSTRQASHRLSRGLHDKVSSFVAILYLVGLVLRYHLLCFFSDFYDVLNFIYLTFFLHFTGAYPLKKA